LASIVRNGIKRWSLQGDFEFELDCLVLFMDYVDLNTLKLDDLNFESFKCLIMGFKIPR